MTINADVRGLDLPRQNGELVFQSPWESRAFGMAVALNESGAYEWRRFRDALVAQIGAHSPDDGGRYYERWLDALQQLVVEIGLVSEGEIVTRVDELAAHDDHHH